ncbi:MAG: hypothetical protein IJ124_00265 [Clostridia bacterium]|nr:hypothetical protein [Clostridia bacterium]
MAQAHIIRRSGRIQKLKAMLAEYRIVYISCFFYSGKTVLLNQLADSLRRPVLRFDAERDAWAAFARAVGDTPGCALLIDGLNRAGDDEAGEAMAELLMNLPEDKCAVIAGRSRCPACLHRLLAGGVAAVLDSAFVLFDEAETEVLFEDYGLRLLPADAAFLKERCLGWPMALHGVARQLLREPHRPVPSVLDGVLEEMSRLLNNDVVLAFPEQERILLYNLSPFERFSEDMARMVTGRIDAPKALERIAQKSYILFEAGPGRYRFMPFVRKTLFREARNLYSQEYIDGLYRRAALYFELQERLSEAARYYMQLGEREKLRQLLIRDAQNRPANGDYVELRGAYAMLDERTLLESPALMKGMCMIEFLLGHAEEGRRWYEALRRFIRQTPAKDARRRAAEEALIYLDIARPDLGSRGVLNTLLAVTRLPELTRSDTWRSGFNVAGNSASLLNGGKDFCRWVPHGRRIYRLFRAPVEFAVGRGGSGMADIAMGECELESNLDGDYTSALDRVCAGLARVTEDLEMRCAAVGIQSRILAAQGSAAEALDLMDSLIASLPEDAPQRLRRNLNIHRLTLMLLTGDTSRAQSWLYDEAPDENGDFVILDRYGYMLKLRLYILTAQWSRTPLLTAKLRQYFDSYDRPYMRAQLHLLQAVIDRRMGRDGWREELMSALAIARRYRLARVVADEGIAIVDMLGELELPDESWERGVQRLVRAQAAHYPLWMKQTANRPVFTDRERQVYSLMIAGYRNARIADILNITERTVKHHTAEIYRKLGVENRAEALKCAAELGDMR